MKPNIFKSGTKELSQDAFFKWFFDWAQNENFKYDKCLNLTSQDFLRFIITKDSNLKIDKIDKVEVKRQWNNIDILVEINEKFIIVIEDKINALEHSDQLNRYKKKIDECKEYHNFEKVYVYLKTGNESLTSLKEIQKKGWKTINRTEVLSVFNQCKTNNNIFLDFREYLNYIEDETNLFFLYENALNKRLACEGFYLEIEKNINHRCEFKDFSHAGGGSFSFDYVYKDNFLVFIENKIVAQSFVGHMNFLIKIKKDAKLNLHDVYSKLSNISKNKNIIFNKPKKLTKSGQDWWGVAVVEKAFPVKPDKTFDFDKFFEILTKVEEIIDEYSKGSL